MLKILIVDDNPGDARLVDETLLDCDSIEEFESSFCTCIEDLYKAIRSQNDLDLIILDLGLPDVDHDGILECITRVSPRVAIIVLTGGDNVLAEQAIERGAQDYLIKNELDEKLLTRAIKYALSRQKLVSQLHHMNKQQEYMATHDQLTGLINRSKFSKDAQSMIDSCLKGDNLGALLFLDLDGFKNVNDTFGHAAGDILLVSVAKRIGDVIRNGDSFSKASNAEDEEDIARIGGDEFVILLREFHNDKNNVFMVAERIISKITEPYEIEGFKVNVSASVGVT
jgi:diguanylate cyclase (GGDEF)-like protein